MEPVEGRVYKMFAPCVRRGRHALFTLDVQWDGGVPYWVQNWKVQDGIELADRRVQLDRDLMVWHRNGKAELLYTGRPLQLPADAEAFPGER